VPHNHLLQKAGAEFLGTFAIILFGCGAIRLGLSPGMVSLVFGLTVAVMIYALGPLSGAHFNPAVSLGFLLARGFPTRQAWVYGVVQVLGAVLAVGLLAFLLPEGPGYGAVVTHVSLLETFLWETFLTFLLMGVILWSTLDPAWAKVIAGAAIGGYVAIGSTIGGPLTGAAMNPARYLAPAFTEGKLELGWVYLPAAFLGAGLAAMLYKKFRNEKGARRPVAS